MIRSICKNAIALLVLMSWCLPAWATDYYVSGYATWGAANPVGSDAANGTSPNTPKATLASLASTIATGDTVYMAGINFSDPTAPFAVSSKNNVSIVQWGGATQAHIHGGVRAPMTGWTQSTNRYSISVGTGLTITGVTWNYDSSQDANGMRRAWLKPAGQTGNAASYTTVTWTESTHTLTKTGAFTNCAVGSAIRVTGGTAATTGTYIVTTKTSNDAVIVMTDASTDGSNQSDWAITIDGVQDTAWTWFYDSSGGLLYINANVGSPNSGTDVVTYVKYTGTTATTGNLNGIYFNGGSGIVVAGIQTSGFIGQWHTTTYYCNGIQFYGCTGSTIYNCSDWDAGIHNFVFAGNACTNNKIMNSSGYGGFPRHGSGADGGTTLAFYSDGGNVTGCRAVNITAVCGIILDPTGAEIAPLMTYGAFITHTDGGSHYPLDVEFRDCTIKCLNINVEPICGANNLPATVTTTPDLWWTYPVRLVGCTITGAGGTLPTPLAIVRCRFNLTPLAADPSDTCLMTVAGSSGYYRLFEACDFTMHAAVDDQKIIATASSWDDRFYNCSFLIDRSAAVTFREFIGWSFSTTGKVTAKNCIFADNTATGTTYLCVGDGSAAAGQHVFQNCSYYNIDVWSSNSSFDAQNEWFGTIDASGHAGEPWLTSTFPFASTTSSLLDLNKGSPAWFTRIWIPPYPQRGINGFPPSGNMGSWQYTVMGRLDSMGMRGTSRTGRYLRQ